jgi:hypothetical protein
VEPIAVIVVLIIVFAIFKGGSESNKEDSSEQEKPEPVCSKCTHHISAHQDLSTSCKKEVKTPTQWERDRVTGAEVESKWELRQCACSGYDGPPLIDSADAHRPQDAKRFQKESGSDS